MRILINSINYAPELTGIGKFTGEMAEWLAAQGHSVRVVTAPPYYPDWRVGAGYRGWAYRRERIAGVDVIRCPLWVPRRPSGLKRLLHLATFALSSAPVMLWSGLRQRPDVVLVIEPPLMCAFGAWLAARVGGAQAWLHVQDFEVDAAFELGVIRSRFAARLARAVERFLLARFDIVSTISERMLDRLAAKGVPAEKRRLFVNWVDTGRIRPLSDAAGFRDELGIPGDATVLLYSGSMGQKQGLELLVELARRMDEQPAVVVLCGEGPGRTRLEALAKGLQNIRFLPLQPYERLNELLNAADIHLLPQRDDAADLVMPSKLTAMLASGRPVVATAREGTQVAEVVGRCGIVVPPGDVAQLAAAAKALVSDSPRRDNLGRRAREYALEHFERDRVLGAAFGPLTKN